MALLRVLWIVFKQIVLFFSGEYYLGYKKFDLKGVSWYNLLHPECIKEVQSKHRLSKYITKPLATEMYSLKILLFDKFQMDYLV